MKIVFSSFTFQSVNNNRQIFVAINILINLRISLGLRQKNHYLVGGPSYLLGSFFCFLVPSARCLGFLASLLPLFLSPIIIPKLNSY